MVRDGAPVPRCGGSVRTENADEEGALTWLEGRSASEGAPMARTFVLRRFVGRDEESDFRDIESCSSGPCSRVRIVTARDVKS